MWLTGGDVRQRIEVAGVEVAEVVDGEVRNVDTGAVGIEHRTGRGVHIYAIITWRDPVAGVVQDIHLSGAVDRQIEIGARGHQR